MKRRIFVAVKISAGLQKEITNWQNSHKNFPVRWIAPKNLHVTIIPPWHTGEVDSAKQQLRAVSGVEPFTIKFNSISLGPDAKAPRLIWAEGPTPAPLRELKNKIELALGQPSQNRNFHTHITLARFKNEPLKDIFSAHKQPIDWHESVSDFVLMEFHLGPGGSDYEILESFPLK